MLRLASNVVNFPNAKLTSTFLCDAIPGRKIEGILSLLNPEQTVRLLAAVQSVGVLVRDIQLVQKHSCKTEAWDVNFSDHEWCHVTRYCWLNASTTFPLPARRSSTTAISVIGHAAKRYDTHARGEATACVILLSPVPDRMFQDITRKR